MAKQAVITTVASINPIEGADAVESVRVDGWNVVARKGDFKVGDKVVYVCIDSILPVERPEFAFLAKGGSGRIKTRTIRGALSQGICFPLNILPAGTYEVGTDVTDLIGATHYEKPVPAHLMGQIKGNFPPFFPKTDETMLQSCLPVLDELRGKPYYITVKCDGSSLSVFHLNGQFGVCSRNMELKNDGQNTYWKVALQYDLENKMKTYGHNLVIQGELIGEGIQKNRLGIKGHDIKVFNVYDLDAGRLVDFVELQKIVADLGLTMVPIEEEGEAFNYTLDELLAKAEGTYVGTSNRREGIVIRPKEGFYCKTLHGRCSFKVLSNKYLLKDEE
jgi:RNA ligase (TIGR02306 family)